MNKFRRLLPAIFLLLAADRSAFAETARTISPELVGITRVALNFSPQTLPGLDTNAVEKEIRITLEGAHITVEQRAPVTLFVSITYQRIPACPEFIAFRVYIALSEDVAVHRGKRTETVYADTWHDSQESVEPISTAGKAAGETVVGLLTSMIDTAKYTAEVMEKQGRLTPSRRKQ